MRERSRSAAGTTPHPRGVAKASFAGLCLLLVGMAALVLQQEPGGATAPAEAKSEARSEPGPTPALAWMPIIRPIRLFALESRDLAKAAADYEASRPTSGGGRQDDLTFGAEVRTDAPFLRVGVRRVGNDAARPSPFFVGLTLGASSAGLVVTKMTPAGPISTKFGQMETADVTLAAHGAERSCLAFRRAVAGEPVRISGWFCPPAGSAVKREALSCLVDRLELLSAGEDVALRDSFVAAEKRRGACEDQRPMTADALPFSPEAARPATPHPRRRRHWRGTHRR